ncbi:GPR54-like protein, partial [Mya arenaria]
YIKNNCYGTYPQVVKMLVTVVVLFILCWGPKLILELFKRLRLDFVYYPEVFQAQIGIYCLTYVQSCVNPVIYGLMCRNFRQSLKYACSTLCSCKRSKDDINVILENFSLEVESRYSADNYKKSINRHGTSHMHVH